jgi:hypothetical protein
MKMFRGNTRGKPEGEEKGAENLFLNKTKKIKNTLFNQQNTKYFSKNKT